MVPLFFLVTVPLLEQAALRSWCVELPTPSKTHPLLLLQECVSVCD